MLRLILFPLLALGFFPFIDVKAEPFYEVGTNSLGQKWMRGKINSNEDPKIKLTMFCKITGGLSGEMITTSINTAYDPLSAQVTGADSWSIPLSGVFVSWDNQEPEPRLWLHTSPNNLTMAVAYKSETGATEVRTGGKNTRSYNRKLLDHQSLAIKYKARKNSETNFQDRNASFNLEKFHPLLIRAKTEGCEGLY